MPPTISTSAHASSDASSPSDSVNYLKIGKLVRFDQNDLDAWVQQQRVDSAAPCLTLYGRPSASPRCAAISASINTFERSRSSWKTPA